MNAIRRCIPTADYIIKPYAWQSYGYYADYPHAEPKVSWFAGAVRASNSFMAHLAALEQAHPYGPVVTALRPIDPMPRPDSDRKRFKRDNPSL